jgi:hypothetical protein
MSTTNLKYFQLLQQIEKNPFAKTVAPAVFDIASDFRKDMEVVGADRRLSPEGKWDAAQKHLREALRDLRDIQKPLAEYHSKTETMRAAVKKPAYDKADIVGAMARRELRDASRAMTSGQRAGHMAGPTRSIVFLDAVLEFEDDPWMSGIDIFNPNELQIYEAAKQERLRDFHGPLIDQIAERDSTESEVRDLIVAVARVDIQDASGLSGREFEAVAKPIESKVGAPWLKRYMENGVEVIRVVDFEAPGGPVGRIATEAEKRDGQFFKDFAEYQAARAA